LPVADDAGRLRASAPAGGAVLSPDLVLALASSPALASLDDAERFALELLLDLSRVLRADASVGAQSAAVVRLHVGDTGAAPPGLPELRAPGGLLDSADGTVTIDRALLRTVHAVATAAAEQRSTERDRFGRVPPRVNALVEQRLEREPVLSDLARSLADAVRRAAGDRTALFLAPWPHGKRWAAALTHDLDVVQWWPAFTALRLLELARKGEARQLARVIGAAGASVGRDVVRRGVREVLEAEGAHGVRSTWFVLCGTPTFASARAGDLTYSPESALARRILADVRAAGHEIGLHGSFVTADDPHHFVDQRRRLEALTAGPTQGARQHFLRMQPVRTQRGMAAAGFRYDSTFGFPDRNGFRLGVADVVPLRDVGAGDALPLDEAPFVWMDRALSKYAGVERPDAWVDDALLLADKCREVEGLWVGIWHPNLTPALGFPGAPAAYARLVRALRDRDAWIAPLSEIVAWRRARRAVRAAEPATHGGVSLSFVDPLPSGAELVVEDRRGARVETRVER
jgi:hypothetical protein